MKRRTDLFKVIETCWGEFIKELIEEKRIETETGIVRQHQMEKRRLERELDTTQETTIRKYETNIIRRRRGEDSTNFYKKHE